MFLPACMLSASHKFLVPLELVRAGASFKPLFCNLKVYYFICCVYTCMCVKTNMNYIVLLEVMAPCGSQFSLHHVGHSDQAQIVRLGERHP